MSRLESLDNKRISLGAQVIDLLSEEQYEEAHRVIEQLKINSKRIEIEKNNASIPIAEDIEFDDLRIGMIFREESSTTDEDGQFYYHQVLFITSKPASNGLRTVFTKCTYGGADDFWYGTVDEDYFK